MEMMLTNWYVWFALACVIIVAALILYRFFKLPTAEQLDNVREWLLFAVTQAETELGSGTGQLKLRLVYDQFLTRFPALALRISFQTFSEMVDDALVEMREMLAKNENIAALVNGND